MTHTAETQTILRPGDVLSYEVDGNEWHCRERTAIVEERQGRLVAFDTFWGISGSDRHVLTKSELATAQVDFNLEDVEPYQGQSYAFKDFAREDRFTITSQHGLQANRFIRKGAQPSDETMLRNEIDAAIEDRRKAENAESRARHSASLVAPKMAGADMVKLFGACGGDSGLCVTHGWELNFGDEHCAYLTQRLNFQASRATLLD